MASDDPSRTSSDEQNLGVRKAQSDPVVFLPAAGRLPSPKAMAEYAAIDPSYPDRLMETFRLELKRNYQYQLVALVAGWTFALALAVEAGILTTRGHEKMALGRMRWDSPPSC